MPRIEPLQLLKCLRVLLDDNGGILSATDVPRIAGLMTKYSKKLVSKCIYVQILKSTKTELLGEFMGVGGWSLTYNWLNDSIRAMNWPLVQEILELLLLSPVDVNRLKINTAPKLVKGLCKDGGNEGVRILAKRLVEQWLKIVTEQSAITAPVSTSKVAVTNPTATKAPQSNSVPTTTIEQQSTDSTEVSSSPTEQSSDDVNTATETDAANSLNYTMTSTQRKTNNQAGLVFKLVVNDGQQCLKQIEKTNNQQNDDDCHDGSDNSQTENLNSSISGNQSSSEIIENKGDGGQVRGLKLSEENSSEKKQKSSRDKDREKDKKTSSHKSSSSSHKSSSSSSKNSSSSKSSSSSSSQRSSSDKSRDKDRERSSSSGKDKERSSKDGDSSSSSSSKRKSKSSSSSSSSSSKDRKDRDKEKSTSSSTKKDKDRSEQDKDNKIMLPPASVVTDKKSKEDVESQKPKSITIPNRKASISIEIRRDVDKAKTVKTYNSQFRSHGLTEEAPRPPSRKDLKKPGSVTAATLPTSLPSSTLKRLSPPPKESSAEKKPKVDMAHVNGVIEKAGSIKLIPPKKIQTLVETNLFSDALTASIEPKKVVKRKRPLPASPTSKDVPTSPETTKVAPLKFYQDTLDESKSEEKLVDKDESLKENKAIDADKSVSIDDDDDIPLKKVKEDIEQQVQKEKSLAGTADNEVSAEGEKNDVDTNAAEEIRKPGPGCGPDGPPGVLMLHRRKGPKKKLTWQTDDKLTQVRFFDVDRSERVNVSKQSFLEMQNLERYGERDALTIARRGFDDSMEPQMEWRPLIEVDFVPTHPNGMNSKQRAEQAAREMTTLRALYFSHQMIPDSPTEAEIEPHSAHDVQIIPLEDLTGNQDAINDFSSTPWPEPRGMAPSAEMVLGAINDVVGGLVNSTIAAQMDPSAVNNSPFNHFGNNFDLNVPNIPPQQKMGMGLQPQGSPTPVIWGNQNGPVMGPGPIMGGPGGLGNAFGSPNMDMNSPIGNNMMGGPPQQNFVNGPFNNPPFNNMNGPPGPHFGPGPQVFNNGPFGPMGQCPPNMNNNMNGNNPMMTNQRNNNNNNNNRGNNNWRSGHNNFQDNAGGGGNWRPAGSGPNGRNGNGNNGICKAFMRGHCRLGKSCKYVHPQKKRM